MSEQKFEVGDLVHIAPDLGRSMRHFQADADAIVLGSYADLHHGDDSENYAVFIQGSGHHSWYREDQLTLIDRGRIKLLRQWRDELHRKNRDHPCTDS